MIDAHRSRPCYSRAGASTKSDLQSDGICVRRNLGSCSSATLEESPILLDVYVTQQEHPFEAASEM